MRSLKNLFCKYSDSDKNLEEAIKNIFGFSPKNIAPYKLACKHRSVVQADENGYKISNERLEFLGDAILGSIVAEYLFKKFPFKDEGFLTDIRSRIVSRSSLNNLSRKLGLNQLIETQKEKNKTITSIPGDALEAFIGAIYLDRGYKLTREIIIDKIINCHIDIDELISTEVNFKSKLIEWGQKHKKTVNFNLVEEKDYNGKFKIYTIDVAVGEDVLGIGKNYSIKAAEQDAAKIAWNKISQE